MLPSFVFLFENDNVYNAECVVNTVRLQRESLCDRKAKKHVKIYSCLLTAVSWNSALDFPFCWGELPRRSVCKFLWKEKACLTTKKGKLFNDKLISYLSDIAEDALPRLDVCWSGLDWVDSFRALLLRSGLESVWDKSLCEPWDPEACKEFWEPNLPLTTGIAGTAKPLWSAVCDWFAPL